MTSSLTVPSRSLELPDGYQSFEYDYPPDVHVNEVDSLVSQLNDRAEDELYLYTQHQIAWQDGVLKQTRSSPNWEGGLVTFSTCKHFMRTYNRDWVGTWISGLCPKECENNCILFCGRVAHSFASNYLLRKWVLNNHPQAYKAKRANTNPRGDLYAPINPMAAEDQHNHQNFEEPQNHTRSVDFYKHSPGSISDRPDGKVPKWWRDLEYVQRGVHPPVFVLSPCWLFSRPLAWTNHQPKRAVLRLTAGGLAASLC